MTHHPDRNPNNPDAEERFKEITEAYAILADSEKRSLYDRFGHAGVSGNSAGPAGFDPAIFQDFGDIFGDIFGFGDAFGQGSRRRSRAQRGADLREDLNLEFDEAVFGTDKEVNVRRHETCDACRGAGTAPGKAPVSCQSCNGRGQVRYQQGFFSIARTCPTCQGAGNVITDPCPKCKGEGRLLREREVEATVPAGVEDGTRIRFTGLGEAGSFGGPAGDLYVVLHV
jgi:molecular chaperone DnaJ